MAAWSNWLNAALSRTIKRSRDSFCRAFSMSFCMKSADLGAYCSQAACTSVAPNGVCILCNTRKASPKRSRNRVLSSAVAALVNVTTKILSTGICSSSTNRANKAEIFHVLPVPALASIRLVATRGTFRGAKSWLISNLYRIKKSLANTVNTIRANKANTPYMAGLYHVGRSSSSLAIGK